MAKRKSNPYLPEHANWLKIRNRNYSQWIGREERFERERSLGALPADPCSHPLRGEPITHSPKVVVSVDSIALARTVLHRQKGSRQVRVDQSQ